MAASAFNFYNKAKEYLGDNTIDIDVQGDFRVHLCTSASNASTATLSTLSQITNELASSNGYTLAGNILTAETWGAGASAGQTRFDGSVPSWTASGGNLGGTSTIRYAVMVVETGASATDPANKLLGWWSLSTAGFAVTDTNSLTINIPATGIFNLA